MFDLFKTLFQKCFFNFSFSLRLGKAKSSNFCRFPPKILQGFPLPKRVSPFYPSFCILFHVCMHLFEFFGLCINWDFCLIKAYFMKLINGFCCYIDIFIIYDGIFDQFGVLWKIKILGLVPIWGFCSIGLKLMKLACWIDVIDHSKLFSNLCDDQLVNFFKNIQVVLKFLEFLLGTLCSSKFCEFELKLNLIHCFSTCIMSFNLFMHHIAFDLYLCANLQSALGFVFFFFSLYFAVCFWFLF